MGAEEISRKGISNVEQGLTKVTGINSVEGRGLFVRGLEERYSYLLIDGLGSPSNNPFQKIIALKQFPTDVVGKLNIYKTFNADHMVTLPELLSILKPLPTRSLLLK